MEKFQESWNNYKKALYYDFQGDWEKAHEIVQDLGDADAAWIHAYLHRKEGDPSNASYWYSRASKPFPNVSLEEEWKSLWDTFS